MPGLVPDGHIDQLIRQTRAHHVQLSVMADLKANMLLTIASVVLSLTVPQLGKLAYRDAAITLLIFCLLTIVLAASVAMPTAPALFRRKRDTAAGTINLLFFGHFVDLDYPEYLTRMMDTLADPERVYEAQIREIYQLGQFLAKKKYRVLRLAYVTFIVGLIASGLVLFLSSP